MRVQSIENVAAYLESFQIESALAVLPEGLAREYSHQGSQSKDRSQASPVHHARTLGDTTVHPCMCQPVTQLRLGPLERAFLPYLTTLLMPQACGSLPEWHHVSGPVPTWVPLKSVRLDSDLASACTAERAYKKAKSFYTSHIASTTRRASTEFSSCPTAQAKGAVT